MHCYTVYILSHFALRCFYILWLNLALMPLLTHHETRDECKGVLIFILLPMAFIFSAIFTMGATLPFSSLTHFSSLGFSTAPPTMSPTPIRPGNSSPASVQVLQVLPPTCEVWASVRPLYFFSHVWDIMRITPAVEGWTAIVYHVQMYKRILGFFIKSS